MTGLAPRSLVRQCHPTTPPQKTPVSVRTQDPVTSSPSIAGGRQRQSDQEEHPIDNVDIAAARAYYDQLRARGVGHHAALRQLGNRLVGILHGCLKTNTTYDETTAWAHHQQDPQAAA
jgi:hypothetical protein